MSDMRTHRPARSLKWRFLQVLKGLGMRKALIVHSQGLDELTPMGPAEVVEVTGDSSHSYRCFVGFSVAYQEIIELCNVGSPVPAALRSVGQSCGAATYVWQRQWHKPSHSHL